MSFESATLAVVVTLLSLTVAVVGAVLNRGLRGNDGQLAGVRATLDELRAEMRRAGEDARRVETELRALHAQQHHTAARVTVAEERLTDLRSLTTHPEE